MQDKNEFIARELMPIAGDFADDYDWDAICDEVAEFDPVHGYVWRAEFDDTDDTCDNDALYAIMAAHELMIG